MAFSFYGTFTTAQWDELREFGKIQKVELLSRKSWLQKMLSNNGIFVTNYDENGYPIEMMDDESPGFNCNEGSYGKKLLDAYRMLGGHPERDMLLRTREDAVHLVAGQNLTSGGGTASGGFSDMYSNGRRNRGTMRFDRDLGVKMDRFKSWQLDAIKQKRERLEFKIKRCLDYSHQIQNEIDFIDSLLGINKDGSGVDELIHSVEAEISKEGVMSVINNPNDKFGLNIGRIGDLTFADALDEAAAGDERIPR